MKYCGFVFSSTIGLVICINNYVVFLFVIAAAFLHDMLADQYRPVSILRAHLGCQKNHSVLALFDGGTIPPTRDGRIPARMPGTKMRATTNSRIYSQALSVLETNEHN
mmetsp:Transcript_12112/g.29217  ORF Transcript_12112/g.29217 Transcript_12112/m.29217 type:complete len:108 (-) Transcript_12112:1769-2092(-)